MENGSDTNNSCFLYLFVWIILYIFSYCFFLVWDCWTVHETWNKSNIGGNPVILDMMLLDSIQRWNMSYSHLMCYSNNIQLVIAIWHSMVEFDQIVKNSIHLNKWILNWNKVLKLSSIWYAFVSSLMNCSAVPN
jgi:hypothetical protein